MVKPITIFSAITTRTSKDFNLTERDVIFAHAVAGGADLGDAYNLLIETSIAKKKSTNTAATTAAKDYLTAKPGIRFLIQRLKNKTPLTTNLQELNINTPSLNPDDNTTEEQQQQDEEVLKKFSDKSFIILQLSKSLQNLKGKERAAVLMQIADLQRMKADDIKEDEEKRTFYLPFVSSCKSCKLMKLYKSLFSEIESESK